MSSDLLAMDDTAAAPRWPDLPSDLLRDISGRLLDAVDFVRFHAVCKPWRDTAPPFHSSFLPLLFVKGGSMRNPGPLLRSIFSNTAWRGYSVAPRCHKWLACEDGTGKWLFSTGGEAPCLVNPLTGAVTARLPRFPDEIARIFQYVRDGVVFADGTIVLSSVDAVVKRGWSVVAAVLRLGDAAWTAVVEPLVIITNFSIRSAPAYINGEIVLADTLHLCAVKLRVVGGLADVIQTRCELDDPAGLPGSHRTPYSTDSYSYTFESRGELLTVSIYNGDIERYIRCINEGEWPTDMADPLSVSLHALEMGPDGERPRLVRRDGRSLGDRVLFLGHPASFSVDAARFGGAVDGGCAYVAVKSRRLVLSMSPDVWRVYKYSFLDDSSTAVADLPGGWETEGSIMWFVPHVAIATTQEIRERLGTPNMIDSAPRSIVLHAEKPRQQRHLGPYFKIYVGNLSDKVDNSRLRQFFEGHGHVADATVVYDYWRRSLRFGFVTMATIEEPAVVLASIDGQVLDGHTLRVAFEEELRWEGTYMPWLLPQQQPMYWWWQW